MKVFHNDDDEKEFGKFMDFLYGISLAIVTFTIMAIVIAIAYWWW